MRTKAKWSTLVSRMNKKIGHEKFRMDGYGHILKLDNEENVYFPYLNIDIDHKDEFLLNKTTEGT